ncbi:Oxidative stress 3 [Melia azedarach]|uniref:Oxidative stress 3 n=1 Tax=Melia azedarach TaxID=155640 RepID=A0ACC1XYH7_MELAZ|nr:Oxidative stress 3 [Melia azedarach]
MASLQANLPQNSSKRGLSRYYSGKARSFTCMGDVHCLEDLKKQEHPDAKKRKHKYLNRNKEMMMMNMPNNNNHHNNNNNNNNNTNNISPYPCRRVSSSTQCATPYVH